MRILKSVFLFSLAFQMIASAANGQWLDPKKNETEEDESVGIEKYYEWFYHARTFGLGYIPDNAYSNAVKSRSELASRYGGKNSLLSTPTGTLSTVNWKNIGPYNIDSYFGGPHSGRINTIAVDPTNSKVAYFGAANGGVWKTTNGGQTWRPTSDQAGSLAMGALAIDPINPNTIYAGTGEYSRGVGSFFGGGILKSTDAGGSWKPLGLGNVGAFSKIIVHPTNPNVIYAAGAGSGSGLYQTADAGKTWKRTDASLPPGAVTDIDLVVKGASEALYAAIPSHGIYISNDGGKFWSQSNIDFSQMRRLHVAADPNNPLDVVALSVDYGGNFEGLQRSIDGGSEWEDIGSDLAGQTPFGSNSQGWYDAYLTRDPKDPDHFLFGAISVWETRDGGGSWSDVGKSYQSDGIHPDQHVAAFAPDGSLYVGSDGGIAISEDGGSSYDVLDDSTAITETYGMAIDQTVPDLTYIGTQDNGTLAGSGKDNWYVIAGGDGGTVVVDSKNHDRIYFIRPTAWSISVYTTAGGESGFNTGINASDSVSWIKPLVQDETNHILYTGSQYLYFYADGASKWTRRSKQLAPGSYISAIGPSGDGTSLMVGTTDGRLWTTTNNGQSFTASTGLPGRQINDLIVSPASKTTYYAALSGFGSGHIFKTVNFGVDWTNISGALPDISVNKIVVDPEHPTHLYIATDVGAFYSPNDGIDWVPYGNGFPNVAIFDMQMHKTSRVLRAATHGRSVWEAPMDDIPTGITTPTLASIWYVGEHASIGWYGLPPISPDDKIKVEISTDDAKTWTTLYDTTASITNIDISTVTAAPSEEALVRISSRTEVLLSQHFKIEQRAAGSSLRVFSEQPLYMYDLAYDADDQILWVTNYSDGDNKIYKMDPNTGVITGNITVAGGAAFTGIKYDPQTKHLFANSTPSTGGPCYTYELGTDGTRIKRYINVAGTAYATGIYPIDDTLYIADRNNNVIHRVNKADPTIRYEDLALERRAAFGPRCLTINQKNGALLHTWTDFQGSAASATLYDSYLLTLSRNDGTELSSLFVQEGGNNGTNVRGLEYDPRSDGKEVWVTVLNSGNSSKIMKLTLVDGPSSGSNSVRTHNSILSSLSVFPNPIHDAATVSYQLKNTAAVKIVVRDILGRVAYSLLEEVESMGEHAHHLNLESLAAGGYTVAIYSGESVLATASIVVY